MNKRMDWLDMSRGVAMLLVMLGHTSGLSWFVYSLIFSFHVPLFFLLSGYVYRKKNGSWYRDLRRLLLPYGIVCSIMSFLYLIGGAAYYDTFPQLLLSMIFGSGSDYNGIKLIGAVWFFPAMYITRRLMDIVFQAKTEMHRAMLVCGAFTVGLILSRLCIWLPMSADIALTAVVFMYCGYLLRENGMPKQVIAVPCAIVIWLLSIKVAGMINVAGRDYGMWYWIFPGALAGSYLVIAACNFLERIPLLRHGLSFLGRNTDLMLCVHAIGWCLPYRIWDAPVLYDWLGGTAIYAYAVICVRMLFDFALFGLVYFLMRKRRSFAIHF